MNEGQIKVIYIAGSTRSGSTILGNILGAIDGFFNAGELIHIWDRGIRSNGLCSCGVPISKCEVWKSVIDKAFHGIKGINLKKMIKFRNSVSHSSSVPLHLLLPDTESRLESKLSEYLLNLNELYKAIQFETHSRVIVDSSKNAGYAYIFKMIPLIDFYIIHLIRDPRATAYSWLRKKEDLWIANPIKTSLIWDIRNIVTEMLGTNSKAKYLQIYYEDFVARPQETVKRILTLIHEQPLELPFITQNKVNLEVSHGVYGNPNRFKNGVTKIKLDERWKSMRSIPSFLVTVLTFPLLIRYGYLKRIHNYKHI